MIRGLFKRARAAGDDDADARTLFFASDLHGAEICFRKFLAAAKFYQADVLILGGDIAGKQVIPILETAPGRFSATFRQQVREMTGGGLADFTREVQGMGYYTRHVDQAELDRCSRNPERAETLFKEAMRESINRWIDLAEEKLRGTEVEILFAPGNDDPEIVDEVVVARNSRHFRFVEGEVVEVAPGHEMLSTGYTNVTPWSTPREYSEEVIARRIDEIAARLRCPETAVFNLHVPPYDSRLDTAPVVQGDLSVKTSFGQPLTGPAGSTAVRSALERYQPLLSLHGHIHESAGVVHIGRTLAINPGSEYGEGVLRGALLRIGGGKLIRRQLTIG